LEVVQRYDIHDYRPKSEMSSQRLTTAIYGALRAFAAIRRADLMARLDDETALENRLGLLKYLEMPTTVSSDRTLIWFDIAGFSLINETLGYPTGSAVLRVIADRLLQLEGVSHAARLHSDVFSLVVDEAVLPPARVLDALRKPIVADGNTFHLNAKAGVHHLMSGRDTDAHEATRKVRIALSEAKSIGAPEPVPYTDAMYEGVRRRSEILASLRDVLKDGGLAVVYQPQLAAADGSVVGMEALLRWPGGPSPAEFVPIAEASGLIEQIGKWVLRQALADLVRLDAAGLHVPNVAVNVSAAQCRHGGLVDLVTSCLSESGLSAERLTIEVTESVLMHDLDWFATELSGLVDLGVGVAIDDFGTGYSSLRYLAELPATELKIDRAFIARIQEERKGTLARTIATLGRAVGMTVTAEGVETTEQEALVGPFVDTFQGYLFSKPLEMNALTEWLTDTAPNLASPRGHAVSGGPAD